jgi:hypothetical protein
MTRYFEDIALGDAFEPQRLAQNEFRLNNALSSPPQSAKAGVQISRENPERAVNVRQIGSVLVELPLQFVDDASKFSTFFDQA